MNTFVDPFEYPTRASTEAHLDAALLLVGIGAAIGTALSLAGTCVLTGFLFGVRPSDPVVLRGTVVLVAAAGVVQLFSLRCVPRARKIRSIRSGRQKKRPRT